MKNKILFTTGFLFISLFMNAQQAPVSSNGNNEKEITTADTSAQLTFFAGKYFEGKTWLHWEVKNQSCDGMYLIYRSADGKEWEIIGRKEGIGVPVEIPIAYYLQDEHPHTGTNYYRLVHISKDKTYLVSEKISIEAEGTFLGTQ